MLRLLPYLKDYRKESIIGPLFKLLEACFELLVPVVMARIIDVGIKNGNTAYILSMCGLMIALGALGLACSLTAQFFAAKAAVGFATALREDMFAHINGLSYTELDRAGTSTLVMRITNDINQVQTGVNLVLRLFLRSPFIVAGAVFMAFTIDSGLAWIFVVIIPVLSAVIYGIMLVSIPLYKKVQKKLDRVLLLTRENLSGVRVIRAFSGQEDEKKEFEENADGLKNLQLFVGKVSAFLNPVTYIIVNAGIIAVLWLGGRTVYEGSITQGQIIALISYMTQILIALVAMSDLIISATKGFASAARLNDVFDLKPDMAEGTGARETKGEERVRFARVGFTYAGAKEEALSDLDFSVKKGETVGIIGGTGSGKSTLVNLIPRFYDATRGEVLVDGVDVREYTYAQLREKIGVVPQSAVLFSGTIRENMRWGKKDASDEEILRALAVAQAGEFVSEKPEGLDTVIAQGGKNLSGGQRQRLTIARALVGMPEILILDDSASALDFATDARLREAIAGLPGGMTVFIVSQRAASIRRADKIVVLDDGAVAGIGTHEALLGSCEVYREICLSQLSKEEVERS